MLIFILLATLLSQPDRKTEHSPCAQIPLLENFFRFEKARMAGKILEISLNATQHAQDCGALDSYGTEILLRLELEPTKFQCLVRDAEVVTRDWSWESAHKSGQRSEMFRVSAWPIDLTNPSLGKLTIYSRSGDRALVILPDTFFYFEGVRPGGVLHTKLAGDEDDETTSCCWGASQNHLTFVEEAATP
jgi:hypothetical protein